MEPRTKKNEFYALRKPITRQLQSGDKKDTFKELADFRASTVDP
jgi:hypothetical protein